MIKQLGLQNLSLKFRAVNSLRPEYMDASHAMVVADVILSGTPDTQISLKSDSALKPNVDTKIRKLSLTGKLYCRVDCVYWKLWLWFDKDLKVDVKLDLDVSVF